MLQASFVPILKPLPHLAQFLHVSTVLFIGQLYSYCPEAPNGRVKYVAHRASCSFLHHKILQSKTSKPLKDFPQSRGTGILQK